MRSINSIILAVQSQFLKLYIKFSISKPSGHLETPPFYFRPPEENLHWNAASWCDDVHQNVTTKCKNAMSSPDEMLWGIYTNVMMHQWRATAVLPLSPKDKFNTYHSCFMLSTLPRGWGGDREQWRKEQRIHNRWLMCVQMCVETFHNDCSMLKNIFEIAKVAFLKVLK